MKFGKQIAMLSFAALAGIAISGCGKDKEDIHPDFTLPNATASAPSPTQAPLAVNSDLPMAKIGQTHEIEGAGIFFAVREEIPGRQVPSLAGDSVNFSVGLKLGSKTDYIEVFSADLPSLAKNGVKYNALVLDVDRTVDQNYARYADARKPKTKAIIQAIDAASKKHALLLKHLLDCVNSGSQRRNGDLVCGEKKAESLRKAIKDVFEHDKKTKEGLRITELFAFGKPLETPTQVALGINKLLKEMNVEFFACNVPKKAEEERCHVALSVLPPQGL